MEKKLKGKDLSSSTNITFSFFFKFLLLRTLFQRRKKKKKKRKERKICEGRKETEMGGGGWKFL